MKKIVAAAVAAVFALGSLSAIAAQETAAPSSTDQPSTMEKAKKKTKRVAKRTKRKAKRAAHRTEDKMGMNRDNAGAANPK
jgi:hypothetical protein